MQRLIALNERGYAIGEDHHHARLTNREVALMRELREADPKTWTYPRLAEKFGVNRHHARKLCLYLKRAQAPYTFRVGS